MERPVFNVTTARWEAMKQHPTARPSLHVLLGALDVLDSAKTEDDLDVAKKVLARFSDEERALAVVELDAWLEVHP